MSIATKTGDTGTTALMYNRRVPKTHPRVEAYGCVDELNAALGLARSTADRDRVQQQIFDVQKDLVAMMAELATASEDFQRFLDDGVVRINASATAKLDHAIQYLESENISYRGWATPGSTLHSAALDMARTICRRAERRVCALQENGDLRNPEILVYLNRLSDLLWLFARWAEPRPATP